MSAVEARELRKRFGAREALAGVGFDVADGELFGLLGPNGSGKTTLFRILATLLRPDGGQARIFGTDVAEQPGRAREALGVVLQRPALDGKLTVEENLRYHGALYGLRGAALASRIEELLERFELGPRRRDLVERLSGGLCRRCDLARGLLHRPRLLLLDEPSTGLDPAARRELRDQLARLRAEEGTTALLTTHLLDEADGCDRLVILDQGRLVAAGTPSALKEEVGASVITVRADDPAALADAIEARFAVRPRQVDGLLQLERERAHAFIPELIEAFQGAVREVSLHRPSIEDVFIRRTGRRFTEADAPAEAGR